MSGPMETLQEAVERLGSCGYTSSFRARPGGELFVDDVGYAPETLRVEEVVRFEGQSDPEDQAVLFALASADGTRGTFVASYGASVEPEAAAAIQRLEAPSRRRRHEPGSRSGR